MKDQDELDGGPAPKWMLLHVEKWRVANRAAENPRGVLQDGVSQSSDAALSEIPVRHRMPAPPSDQI